MGRCAEKEEEMGTEGTRGVEEMEKGGDFLGLLDSVSFVFLWLNLLCL